MVLLKSLVVLFVVDVVGVNVVVVVIRVVEEDGAVLVLVVVLCVRLLGTMRAMASKIEESRGKTILPCRL